MLRLPQFCFVLASVTAQAGMSLGIYMALAQDHGLMPVHAHLNLLGWVILFLFGLYYQTHKVALDRLSLVQVCTSTIGYLSLTGGLAALLLTGNSGFLPVVLIGSLLVWLDMLMFAIIVWQACRRGSKGI
jgi:hypothetical protein